MKRVPVWFAFPLMRSGGVEGGTYPHHNVTGEVRAECAVTYKIIPFLEIET